MTFTCEVISLAEGEVVYEIRADDSKIKSDVSKAESTIKRSAKSAGTAVEQSADDAQDSIQKTTKETGGLSGALKDVGEKATDAFGKFSPAGGAVGDLVSSFSGLGSSGSAALLGIGSAAVAVGGYAVSSATSIDQAMNQFAASTGVSKESLDSYEETLKSIYTNNYGESFGDIADAMSAVTQQMGDLDQASLQNITESAFTLRDTFGYDINESVRAANAMMTQFGISGDDAMNLIATGAQNGLDFSGELLDSISEYSVQFAKVGLDADDMFAIMESGAESGAFNLDKVGDAIKEMSIRVVDGSATTQEGFSAIGLNADEMAAKFAAGGDSAKEAFDQTIQALADMDDPLAQSQAGVALFGTMWEDLGPEVVTALAGIQDSAYATGEELENMKDVKYDDLGAMLDELKRGFEMLLVPLGEALIPLLSTLMESLKPLMEVLGESLAPIFEQLGEVLLVISEPLGQIVEFIGQILGLGLQLISEALTPILDLIAQLLEPLMQLLDGILNPLMGLFQSLMEPLLSLIQAALEPSLSLVSALIEPLMSLVQAILPPIQELFSALTPILETLFSALEPLFDIFSQIAGLISDVLGPVIETLAGIFSKVLGGAIDAVMPIIEGVMDVFGGLIDFITGVFSGNWEQAWNGIVDMFKGIFNLIPTIVEGIINGAIAIINGIIWGINQLTGAIGIPAIPEIPNVSLPRFHTGGIVDFAMGEGPALLKDGEMVLTQKQQAELFALANGNYSDAANSSVIVVNSPLYLDGKLITDNVTKHQYNDVMAKRYKG